jgi:sulfotransferase family protein
MTDSMTASSDILDAEAMLQAAQAETGLSDWGDETLPDRFRMAVELIKGQGMEAAGQQKAREVCHWLLTTRLEFFEDFNRYPIGKEKIERPLFATGEPRSGTTLLHALLAVDPNGRALRFWELMYPSPPPGLAGPDDPRPARADQDWREILERLPKWWISHPYNDMLGDGLPEDERTWAFDFRVMTPTAWWRVPMDMIVQGLPSNATAQYRIHKMFLQHGQYARPKKYWVLKGFHGFRLKEMFEAYPDMAMIWVHRDPVQAIASRIALTGELNEMLNGTVDWDEQSRIQLAMARMSFKNTLENPLIMDPRIHHVRYPDFVHDPVGTIRGFYEKYGVPFTEETEKAMQHYLANNKADRYGKFKYPTSLIREDLDALDKEFAPFRERWGLEPEPRRS